MCEIIFKNSIIIQFCKNIFITSEARASIILILRSSEFKTEAMRIILSDQIKHENKYWQRSLEFIKQETALLKYRLSEMVDYNEEPQFIPIAEYLQNELLQKDDEVHRLLNNTIEYELGLKQISKAKQIPASLIRQHKRLRSEILQFEKKFLSLSKEFNTKMLQHT